MILFISVAGIKLFFFCKSCHTDEPKINFNFFHRPILNGYRNIENFNSIRLSRSRVIIEVPIIFQNDKDDANCNANNSISRLSFRYKMAALQGTHL